MGLPSEPLAERTRSLVTGACSPSEYTAVLEERWEVHESTIRSFVPPAPAWSEITETMAARLEAKRPPALAGIPVGIKDIIHVDGFETRAGSALPPAAITDRQAAVVTTLEDAGAVILGKTATTEGAYFDPAPTRNPHDPSRTPGGSSSGSAAAVAAGLCPLSIGTQTVGSVIRPAAFCGVVGVKPSTGRIPMDGVLPLAPSADHLGLFTQDVSGARIAAGSLCQDWRSGYRAGSQPTIGAVEGAYLAQASKTGIRHFEEHITTLEQAGFDVRRIDPFRDITETNQHHDRLVAAEAALSHAELFDQFSDRYGSELTDLIESGRQLSVHTLVESRASMTELRRQLMAEDCLGELDVLVSPAAPGPAPTGIGSTGDPIMNLPWTHAGLPAITIPAGLTDDGLPLGLQCVGRMFEDEWLLDWAEDLEGVLAG